MIEEISEVVFNNTTSLTLVSLRHNRLDETRMAPLAWINHRYNSHCHLPATLFTPPSPCNTFIHHPAALLAASSHSNSSHHLNSIQFSRIRMVCLD